jgi:hypothetical protein
MQERILEEMQTICQNVNKEIDAGIDEHDFHKHTDIATGSVIVSHLNIIVYVIFTYRIFPNKRPGASIRENTV